MQNTSASTRCPCDRIIKQDLELGTGIVEGAIKNIIGKRCDHGGMRWIKERAEAVCIDANGDWENFIAFVHRRMHRQSEQDCIRRRLQSSQPANLPRFMEAA